MDPSGNLPVYPVNIAGSGSVQQQSVPDNIYTHKTGLINGQGICFCSEERMGLGTYANNGCGIIAIYNAIQLLGYYESLAVIETEIFINGGYWVGGLLGIKPWVIDDYFEDKNIACSRYLSYDAMSQSITEGDVVVFMTLNNTQNIFKGWHYMAAQYINGKYIVYNMYSNDPGSYSVNSLNQPYGNSAFVCGFVVGG